MRMRLAGMMLVAVAAWAQQPVFEVASIRPNKSGELLMLFQPQEGGRFTAKNCSLALLMQYAYEIWTYQIADAPGWVRSDKYDVAAKAAEGDPQASEVRVMLRQLLEDRFQLKYHWETREAPVYFLAVSKAGKLKESAPGDCPPKNVDGPRAGSPNDAPCGGLRNSPGHTKGIKLTAGDLAASLSFLLGKTVVDKTGLTGKYDVELEWTPERVQMAGATENGPPGIFTAMQEQLGLKLESGKGPVKMMVVDRVERPGEN